MREDVRMCVSATAAKGLCMAFLLLPLTTSPVPAQSQQRAAEVYSTAIEDNSFFIEEAYNQEDRVIQHISNALLSLTPEQQLLYTFTEEVPVGGQSHQLSLTLPISFINPSNRVMAGDLLVNYRYQLFGGDDDWCALAPRFSLILPTGSVSNETGTGVVGAQINIPASKRLSESFVAHVNAGFTLLPRAKQRLESGVEARRSLTITIVGGSLIWLADPDFNVMLEYLTAFSTRPPGDPEGGLSVGTIINPGVRYALNLGSLQIVPGLGFPLTIEGGDTRLGVFLYLSFEHPY